MKQVSRLADTPQALEEELLEPRTRHDRARLLELLAEDFEEVGASGRVFGRDQVLALLMQEKPAEADELSMEDVQVRQLGTDLVQLRYLSRRRSANGDRCAQRTSLWRRSEGKWQMLYHQGTLVPDGDPA